MPIPRLLARLLARGRAAARTVPPALSLAAAACASAGAAASPAADTGAAADGPLVVYVVRHAERADGSRDPSLSDAGRARAAALDSALADAGVATIVTTQFARTRETAAPLGARLGIAPTVVVASGAADGHAGEVARAVRAAPRSGAVLVVGHSNTVPAIVAALGGPRFADLCDADYDNLFVVVLREDGTSRLARTRYGADDDESACEAMRPL